MANILDYLEWRGDLPFEASAFNEVDAVVFSRFSYIPFEGSCRMILVMQSR